MTSRIEFRLRPLASDAPTYAAFSVWADGSPLWPVPGIESAEVDIFEDDILTQLADFWLPLVLRQTYPLAFDRPPERPTSLARMTSERWMMLPEAQVESEAQLVEAFEQAHNLAKCFDGQFGLPPLWLMRDRDRFAIDTLERIVWVGFRHLVRELERLGDGIAERLAALGPRHGALIDAWRTREHAASQKMLEFAVGLSATKAEALLQAGSLDAPRNLSEAANDDDEIAIAARMAGALALEDIKRVIAMARSFDSHLAAPLNDLRCKARKHLDSFAVPLKPYEQGEAAALFVRQALGFGEEPLDIRKLAEQLAVEVRTIDANDRMLSFEALIGLAVAGKRHGPGILLNRSSLNLKVTPRSSHERMLRYTLAHELCHLLLDSDHAFTAVDVLKGRMHPAVESRAQSFAGELLLPTRAAAALWHKRGFPKDEGRLRGVVREAVYGWQVTRAVATWKIEHAARAEDIDLHATLEWIAPYR